MTEFELEILIVAYNSKEILSETLASIAGSSKYKITIIDNASKDNLGDFINQNYPNINYIYNSVNQGYGRAANIGLKQSDAAYTLLLNPDVKTNEAQILELLESARKLENSAITAPCVDKSEIADSKENVLWVVGAIMLFNMEKLNKVGFFDENIFLYYEETDLCKRVIDSGYNITKCNNIYMEHLVGKSSTPNEKIEYLKYWHSGWSKIYFEAKNLSGFEAKFKPYNLLLKYMLKKVIYYFSANDIKKLKYNARFSGALAYVKGEKAFDKNGKPRGLK